MLAPSDMPTHVPVKTPIFYLADGPNKHAGKTRVSIHMCRWMSRIVTTILSVRVERLQEITEEDAQAEGLKCLSKDGRMTWKRGVPDRDGEPGNDDLGWHWHDWCRSPRDAFRKLWESIHGDDTAKGWDANPYVVRIEFAPLKTSAGEASR